jgi:AcrR family transcriptional regulator
MARPPTEQPDGVDTRTRIQRVALELFTEQGYEATSLREIAERLGVTKAALYYHFRSKEEIVQSLFTDQLAKLDELIAWGEGQPRTLETRREFVHRYADLLQSGRPLELMRFFERNQTSMQEKHQAGATIRERIGRLQGLLSTTDDPPAERLRRSLAIMAVHTAWFVLREPDISDEVRRAAAVEVALSLVE